jgi:protein TonB
VELYKGLKGGPGCDKEAQRVVKLMPKWSPGKQNGKSVKVRYILPIFFKLQ